MSKLKSPPRLKRLTSPSHIKTTKLNPFVNIYYEEFLPKYLAEKPKQPATLNCKKDDHVNLKLTHVIRIFTGSRTTPKAPSMNELLLETLKLRQQLNRYENMIANHELLLHEVQEWRNRMTAERALYECLLRYFKQNRCVLA